jgi:hypothetical protein
MFFPKNTLRKYRAGLLAVALGLSASLSAQPFTGLGNLTPPPANNAPLSSNQTPASSPVYVPAKPQGTDQTPDIHDLHNLVPLTFWEQHGLQIILGSVAGILIIAGVLFMVLRKKPVVVLTAYQRALQELQVASALHAAGQDKNFAIASSDAVRRYLENAYKMPAPERTTEEFLQEAARHTWLQGELTALLKRFLEFCDLAKFAGQQFGEEERGQLLASARAFLDAAEKLRVPPPADNKTPKTVATPPAQPTPSTP